MTHIVGDTICVDPEFVLSAVSTLLQSTSYKTPGPHEAPKISKPAYGKKDSEGIRQTRKRGSY